MGKLHEVDFQAPHSDSRLKGHIVKVAVAQLIPRVVEAEARETDQVDIHTLSGEEYIKLYKSMDRDSRRIDAMLLIQSRILLDERLENGGSLTEEEEKLIDNDGLLLQTIGGVRYTEYENDALEDLENSRRSPGEAPLHL